MSWPSRANAAACGAGTAFEDHPNLARTYHDLFGRQRDRPRRDVLERARDRGQLPADTDLDVLLDMRSPGRFRSTWPRDPDTSTVDEVEQCLRAVLRQAGYRPGDE